MSRKDGGFSWFEIAAIDPSRVPSLDEVRAAVIKSLQESATQSDLAAKANALARKIELRREDRRPGRRQWRSSSSKRRGSSVRAGPG